MNSPIDERVDSIIHTTYCAELPSFSHMSHLYKSHPLDDSRAPKWLETGPYMLEDADCNDDELRKDLYGFRLKSAASVISKKVQDRLNRGNHRREELQIL